MATQEFLSGGYIGKLGETVGQHWKQKRYIRRYVIPANPKTPAQMAGRTLFAAAIRLAQEAMVINGHQGVWPTDQITEFQGRTGQALRHLRAGDSEADSLPLFPDGSLFDVLLVAKNLFDMDTSGVEIVLDEASVSKACNVVITIGYYKNDELVQSASNTTVSLYENQDVVDVSRPTNGNFLWPVFIAGAGAVPQVPGVGRVDVAPFNDGWIHRSGHVNVVNALSYSFPNDMLLRLAVDTTFPEELENEDFAAVLYAWSVSDNRFMFFTLTGMARVGTSYIDIDLDRNIDDNKQMTIGGLSDEDSGERDLVIGLRVKTFNPGA
jgi:hypothetical protein